MSRLIKFIWIITTLLFLGILLWVYAYLPENVNIGTDAEGAGNGFIGRESFFYTALVIFAFFNGVLFTLKKWIEMKAGERIYTSHDEPGSLQHDLADWLLGFAASINFFLILGMIYLSVFNNPEGIDFRFYGPIVYAGPIVIGILLLFLPFIFLKKRS